MGNGGGGWDGGGGWNGAIIPIMPSKKDGGGIDGE